MTDPLIVPTVGDTDSVTLLKEIARSAAGAQRDHRERGAFPIDTHRLAGKSATWLVGYAAESARLLADPVYARGITRKMASFGYTPL